ncbi:alkaline shock response membrane anchor protein AmaP [Amycolatopsis sp. K13G38]|uniref:Alkaline shock response membrane anchor protein AmaP n=1 Tax=Amycolatopsis acididurans TaxID=2724524 RepID=A0ABX1IXA8_9PSEU|nr:alkaline shock response membrane anchor protein AmaP [Amycolatopsis acididurans]NKQ52137.1 alkaline shock response membrane anchor protein AmaP [Amycolatopsis acididurans]
MASLNRPARLNRTLLALFGLVLLAAGAFAITTSYGWLRVLDRNRPLVPGTHLPPTWVWYVVTAIAVLVGLLFLRWLGAQALRRPRTVTWRWRGTAATGSTRLEANVATEPFTGEVEGYSGVREASATLSGPQDDPTLLVTVTAGPDADLSVIRERITEQGVPRLCQALDLEALPTVVEFRFATETAPRVR